MKELEEKILEILYRNKRYSRDSKETAREIVELFEQKEPSAEEKAKIIKAWREDTGVLICNTEKELDVPILKKELKKFQKWWNSRYRYYA